MKPLNNCFIFEGLQGKQLELFCDVLTNPMAKCTWFHIITLTALLKTCFLRQSYWLGEKVPIYVFPSIITGQLMFNLHACI